jgi:hypothetical protein
MRMKRNRLKPSSFFATTQQIEQGLLRIIRFLVAFVMLITLLVWCL